MNFAKNTIKFICSYLIERYQYLQIEDKVSTLLPMFFGVPHKSILGPVLFNLHVSELADRTYPVRIQYGSSINIGKSQLLVNAQLKSKKMWKGCYLGHNKTICIHL